MEGSIRNTDYFVPAQHLDTIKRTVSEEIARLTDRRGVGNLGIGISSASSGFNVHSSAILDARVRAEVANIVRQNGGYFNSGSGSNVEWGIGSSVLGGGKSIGRVVSGKINSSNAAYQKIFDDLMARGGAGGDFTNVSLIDEKAATYARLAARSRAALYTKQYAKENPNDPLVKAQAKRNKRIGTRGKLHNAKRGVKFAGRGVGIIAGLLVASATILEKIRDGIIDIGVTVKRQSMGDQRYNFAEGTMLDWERFAAKKGFDKNLLPNAAGTLMSQWSNPLLYNSAPFAKLGPLLGADTVKMTGMAGRGGDENVLGDRKSVV
jgi:hypothetical protein